MTENKNKKFIRVVAPTFVASFEISDGIVIRTAPILKQLRGMTDSQVIKYVARQEWVLQEIKGVHQCSSS
jgi:hypothetical protein